MTSYSLGQLGKEKLCRGRHSKLLLPVDAHGNALFTWKTSVQYHVVVKADTNVEFTTFYKKTRKYCGEILTIELFMVPYSAFWSHFIVYMK